jgi:thioredoxin 1
MTTRPLDLSGLLAELHALEKEKEPSTEKNENMKATIELNETNFEEQALKSNLPVVVDFWADWCGPCKMLAPALEQVAQERQGGAIVAKVNVDENPALAERYHVQSIPTLLYFQGGELRSQSVGVVSKKEILNRLESLKAPAQ